MHDDKLMMNLHNHTTFSDGILAPAELVELAVKAGIKYLYISR